MKVKSRKLKDMRIALIGLLLLGCVPLMAAENPSAKNPAQKKTTLLESLFGSNGAKATGKTVQFTQTENSTIFGATVTYTFDITKRSSRGTPLAAMAAPTSGSLP